MGRLFHRLPPPAAAGPAIGRWLVGPLSAGLAGLAWASVATVRPHPGDRSDLCDIYLLYLALSPRVTPWGAPPGRDYFFSFQLACCCPPRSPASPPPIGPRRLLGLAIPLYMVVMTILHKEVHDVVISELQLRARMNEANRELRVLNTQLGEIALRDDLTGAANRVAFVDALSHVVTGLRRGDAGAGVVFLDLDRLKVVNDSLGHQAGDELLVQAADRIRNVLREGDVLARLGGDEFTVLLRDLHSASEAVDAGLSHPPDLRGAIHHRRKAGTGERQRGRHLFGDRPRDASGPVATGRRSPVRRPRKAAGIGSRRTPPRCIPRPAVASIRRTSFGKPSGKGRSSPTSNRRSTL